MPHHFEFDKKHRILLVIVEGVWGDHEQRTINPEIKRQAIALNAAAGIGDLSRVIRFNVSPAVLQATARDEAPYSAGTPRYLVAPKDHTYGMSRMYQLAADKTRASLKVVRSRDEALEELGALDAEFERVEAGTEAGV
jgi:hypothetical protein